MTTMMVMTMEQMMKSRMLFLMAVTGVMMVMMVMVAIGTMMAVMTVAVVVFRSADNYANR